MKQDYENYGLDDYIRSMKDMGDPFSGDITLIGRESERTRHIFEAYHCKTISEYDEDLRYAAQADSMLAKEGLPRTETEAVRSGYAKAVRTAGDLLVQALGVRGYRFGEDGSRERNTTLRAAELPYMNSRKVDLLMDNHNRQYGQGARPAWISYSVYGTGQDGTAKVQHLEKNLTENYQIEMAAVVAQPGLRSIDRIYGTYYDVTVNRFDREFFMMEADNAEEAIRTFNEAQKSGRIVLDGRTGDNRFQTGPLGYCIFRPGKEEYIPVPEKQIKVETRPGIYPVQVNSLYATHAVVAANDEQEAVSLAEKMIRFQSTGEGMGYEQAVNMSMDEEKLVNRRIFPALRVVREQAMDGAVLMEGKEGGPLRNRLTDVSLMKLSFGKLKIRCKIDGEQQMAKTIKWTDHIRLVNGLTTKEDLAMKYFREELKAGIGQTQDRGMHR